VHWFPLTLICAFSLASADAATKKWLSGCSASELTLLRFTFTGLLVSPLLLLSPFPYLPLQFWYWMALLLPLELLAMLLYLRAIRDYPFSLTLPYLAFTPVFVVLTGWLLLGERISVRGFSGILLVVIGAWILNLKTRDLKQRRGLIAPLLAILENRGSKLMLSVAFIYSITSVGGKGAMQYLPPELFGPFYFSLLGLATLILFTLRAGGIPRILFRQAAAGSLIGVLMAIMVISHFFAIQKVEAAYMIGVKRTSLLFGILYGALLFKEPGLRLHLIAGSLMVAGVLLIAAGS
jgi:drug/metabolite transporter (DMT)-like permease